MKFFLSVCVLGFLVFFGCKKSSGPGGDPPVTNPPVTPPVIVPQTDPPLANTIGFFMDDWEPKTFTVPSFVSATPPSVAAYTVTIDRSTVVTRIPRSLSGNNANLWMTQMVTEPNLISHATNIHPHLIRFPGGSISDVFFWNAQKNVPPADAPAMLVKADGVSEAAGFWYGRNTESWTLSVDNYYTMLQQTGNKGLITINYGYARYGKGSDPVAAAAHLAADWVRYDNGRTKYWEIGNENFGDWEAGYRIKTADNHDGQPEFVSGQLYGQHFKVFADSMRKAAQQTGATIKIGAVMVEGVSPSWATATHKTWNSGLFGAVNNSPDYYVVHNYYTAYLTNAPAAEVLATATVETKKMMDYIRQALPAAGATIKPVALDEWNIFSTGSMQQVSHINGLHADLILGELLNNQFGMSARWDMANGWDNGNDHGMFSQGEAASGETQWDPRPAFYHMYFFQKFLGDRLVTSSHSVPDLESYASSFTSGETAVALINKSTSSRGIEINVKNFNKGARYYWYTLTGGSDNGEFSRKVYVNGSGPGGVAGGPPNYTSVNANSALTANGIRVTVPPRAAVFVVIDKQ
jgi:alpha-L-arabinofuranosidase